MEKHTGRISIVDLAKLFKLPSEEDIEVSDEIYHYAQKGALADGASEAEAEKAALVAEDEARDDAYRAWYDAVISVANTDFELHHLVLVGLGGKRGGKRPYEFRVTASDWREAADEIRTTINGVGMFEFSSLREFLDSGPYTAREAALQHLHWIERRWEVYGDSSPSRRYDRSRR